MRNHIHNSDRFYIDRFNYYITDSDKSRLPTVYHK